MSTLSARRPGSQYIVVELRRRVLRGKWKPRQRITSEHALSAEFGVCRATVTKSLKELEREGLLVSHPGKGRFVADPAVRQRTSAIGLVVASLDDMSHPILHTITQSVRAELLPLNNHLKVIAPNFAHASPEREDPEAMRRLVAPEQLDGVLICSREMPDDHVRLLAAHAPCVMLMHHYREPRLVGVPFDFSGGSYDAAKHLHGLGHRRIAVMTIGDEWVQGRDQFEGARIAMRDADCRLQRITVARNRAEPAREAAMRYLTRVDRPTAIICGSDDIALGLLDAAAALNLSIPRDLSIVGFNDMLTADQAPVAMTTVALDYTAVGRQAVSLLMKMIDNPGCVPLPRLVETRLIERDSTAKP